MNHSYILIDDSDNSDGIVGLINEYQEFLCLAVCKTNRAGLNKTLELKPNMVILVFNGATEEIHPFLSVLGEINEYLNELPYVVVISNTREVAYETYQRGVNAFLLNPVDPDDLRKCLFRYLKNNKKKATEKICIKTQGDYHFLKASNIVYLKADNNTTDFYLSNGKMISGYKTLKHYEKLLPFYFFRIHHSYLISIDYVSRINMSKSSCFLQDNEVVLPFSRTYKENINTIIRRIS